MVQDPVKNYIRAPEGKYQLHSEKAHSCSFSPPRQTRLTYATVELQPGTASKYVIFNSSDALCISPYASIEKVSCWLTKLCEVQHLRTLYTYFQQAPMFTGCSFSSYSFKQLKTACADCRS